MELNQDQTQYRQKLIAQHERLLRGIASRLADEFGEMFTRETLRHYVDDSYAQMSAKAKVLNYIPAFVERFSRQRLRALAKNRGIIEGHSPYVLFVCARNDAASQMAAGLLTLRAEERAAAHSAGTAPAPELLEEAVIVMHEIGVDLSPELPKPITTEIEQAADVVVTLDAHDDIPIVDARRYISWRIPDLHDAGLDGYRELRDLLDQRVSELIKEIAPVRVPSRKAYDDELAALESRLLAMGRAVGNLLSDANRALATLDVASTAGLIAADDAVDEAYLAAERGIIEVIARRQPVAGDLRRLVALLQVGLHLERIGDSAVDVARALRTIDGLRPDPGIVEQLTTIGDRVVSMVELALKALEQRSRELCLEVVAADSSNNEMHRAVFAALVDTAGNGAARTWMLALDHVMRLYERAGDHAVDIAEAVWFQITGELREFGRDR